MARTASGSLRPLSRVLIATDFTPGASLALSRAGRLPLGPRPRLTLLHVLPRAGAPALRARAESEAKARLKDEADRLRKALKAHGADDPRVGTALATGEPFVEILARANHADLLVLGRHGSRRFRDLLLGSTAERVIRVGHVPVLVVTTPARAPYRRPLAAVDLTPASRLALEAAARLLPRGRPMLDVVHVYETAHDRMLRRVAGPQGVAAYCRRCRAEAEEAVSSLLRDSPGGSAVRALLLRRGDPRHTILSMVRHRRADLVAIGSHGQSPMVGALVGSVAEGVVRHAPCDALIVHPA